MNFREWLKINEVGTGTSSIAGFARPIFSEPVKRGNYKDLILGGRPIKEQPRIQR